MSALAHAEAFDDGAALWQAGCEHELEGRRREAPLNRHAVGARGWIKARQRNLEAVSLAAYRAFAAIQPDSQQHLSMLRILCAAAETALKAFRAADNLVDRELVVDLEQMVERTHREIERLDRHRSTHVGRPATHALGRSP